MHFALSDEQQLIRDSAREFFTEFAGREQLRAAIESPPGYDVDLWRRLAQESGWAGIAIEERYGGSGLGMVELALLQHEQGRRLVVSPFFSTVCLAAPLIALAGTETQRAAWLPRIASGRTQLTVAYTGQQGEAGTRGIGARIRRAGDGFVLSGEADFVIHAHSADALLVAARGPGEDASEALSIAVVERGAAGVEIGRRTMLDLTRPLAHVAFNVVRLAPDQVLGEPGAAREPFERALDVARIALAAEAVGVAEASLETTTAYVKDRVQFGRPVGSFQAVKHKCADMRIWVQASTAATYFAAMALDSEHHDADRAVSIAKAYVSDAINRVAGHALQLHGGIGFTWEHDLHLYMRRARVNSVLCGDARYHRERLCATLEDQLA
jgi:alkylation response protein AidB-like acyl-CoA dehydrogenase